MKKTIKTILTASLLLVSLLSTATACGNKKPTSGNPTQSTTEPTIVTSTTGTQTTVAPTEDKSFFMPISDVLSTTGGKTVVSGTIYSGSVKTGDILTLSNLDKNVTITGIEKNNKAYENASKGEEFELSIEGVDGKQIQKGYSLFTPSTKQYYNQLKVNLTTLTKDEGGRNTPFFTKYHLIIKLYPNVILGTTYYTADVYGSILLPSDLECFKAGETHEVTIILKTQFILDKGMEIGAVEGGRKVAYGTITALEHHEHDENYDKMGICNVCTFDQYEMFNFDESKGRYYFKTNLKANHKNFLRVAPYDSSNLEKEWKTHVVGASADDFTLLVYDEEDKLYTGNLKTGKIYLIIIEGKANKNDVTFCLIDSNDKN